MLKAPLALEFPSASYTGLEVSEYLCQTHGWIQASVVDYRSTRPFDLVMCHDVCQYLDDAAAARAIGNLARLCRGVLSFSVPTRRDWRTAAVLLATFGLTLAKDLTKTPDHGLGSWFRALEMG